MIAYRIEYLEKEIIVPSGITFHRLDMALSHELCHEKGNYVFDLGLIMAGDKEQENRIFKKGRYNKIDRWLFDGIKLIYVKSGERYILTLHIVEMDKVPDEHGLFKSTKANQKKTGGEKELNDKYILKFIFMHLDDNDRDYLYKDKACFICNSNVPVVEFKTHEKGIIIVHRCEDCRQDTFHLMQYDYSKIGD